MQVLSEPTYVEGWEELGTTDGYRIVGSHGIAWFVQGPRNAVIAHPPAHLDKWEALDWFRRRQNDAQTTGERP